MLFDLFSIERFRKPNLNFWVHFYIHALKSRNSFRKAKSLFPLQELVGLFFVCLVIFYFFKRLSVKKSINKQRIIPPMLIVETGLNFHHLN